MGNQNDSIQGQDTQDQEKTLSPTGKVQCDDGSRSEGLGPVRGESQGNRSESIAADDSDLPRRYYDREDFLDDGGAIIGGIIGQLQELQQEHLAYVKAHEDRLKKRLEENHAHQKNVLDKMEALEENARLYLAQVKAQRENNN